MYKYTKYMQQWRKLHPENREYQKQYQKKYATPENKVKAIKRARVYYKNNKSHVLKREWQYHRLKIYGLTQEDFDKFLKEQNNVCAICEKACVTNNTLSIDHDHNTKQVRGLLCRKCNSGIGMLDDSPELLQKAIKYLKRYK